MCNDETDQDHPWDHPPDRFDCIISLGIPARTARDSDAANLAHRIAIANPINIPDTIPGGGSAET